MCFPVYKELSVGQEAGLAVQLYADVRPHTTVDLQMIVKMGDVYKVAAAVLANNLFALHFKEGLRFLIVPMSFNVCNEIFEKFEAPSAFSNRAHIVLTTVCVAPFQSDLNITNQPPILA